MPVCNVAPSGTKLRTCSAMARSTSVGGGVAQEPLERAVEAAEVVDVRVGEEVGQHGEEGPADAEVLPVGPPTEGLEERGWLAGAERHAERVHRAHEGGGLVGARADH